MKKILMITALCAIIMASAGCKNNEENVGGENLPSINQEQNDNQQTFTDIENNDSEDDKEPEQKPVEDDNKQPEIPDEDDKEPEQKPVEDDKEPEQKPVEDDKEPEQKPVEDDNKQPEIPDKDENVNVAFTEIEKVMNSIIDEGKVEIRMPFNQEITSDIAAAFVGLSAEDFSNNAECGIATESMVMPSNQSFSLIKLKDGSDVEALKKKIFENCDPNKWICMSAEYVLVAGSEDYVMLAMASEDTCKAFYNTFSTKLGSVGEILEKKVEF